MNAIWATTDIETIKTLALGVSGAAIVIGLIMMKVVSSIVGRVISLVIFVAIALAGYSQRAQLTDCANAVKNTTTSASSLTTTCTFFGKDITVKIPQPSK